MLKDLVKVIRELNLEKKELESKLEEIKNQILELDTKINVGKEQALELMKLENLKEYHTEDNLVIFKDTRKTTGYTKEEEIKILNILKDLNLLSCISIKESLAKNNLKKELKVNTNLQDLLKDYGKENITEYVSVMTEEDALKRKEAIENQK